MKNVIIIAAIADNNALGYKNDLIYHLSPDLKRFKSLTSGHTVIMGRKTFQSLPNGPLPNRRNIVISRQNLNIDGADVYNSLESALDACTDDEKVYIIGGAQIYAESLKYADTLEITHIYDTPDKADVFFPQINNDWHLQQSEQYDGEKICAYKFSFETWKRKFNFINNL